MKKKRENNIKTKTRIKVMEGQNQNPCQTILRSHLVW